MFNKILATAILILGIIALVVFTRDNPASADGEPTIVVKNWVAKTLPSGENTTIPGTLLEETWNEDYLGSGKWVVSRHRTYEPRIESFRDIEEWINRWRQMDVNKLREYTNDMPPEDLVTFQEGLWTTDSSDDLYQRRRDSWYFYEKSGQIANTDIDVGFKKE
jgi:hypothetical protein